MTAGERAGASAATRRPGHVDRPASGGAAGSTAAPPSRPADGSLPPAGRRGATVVPESVVARIAHQAALEALARHTADPSRPTRAPRATATVHNGAARLDVTADLPYPVDIAGTGEDIRRYVSSRVAHLTGLRIDHVGLTVGRLVPDERRGRVR